MHLAKLGTRILLAGLCLCGPVAVCAQAPPGPLPAGQPQDVPTSAAKPRNLPPEPLPRTTILGAWKFNRDESDDPRKRREDDRDSQGGRGRVGMGYPGEGHGGYARRGGESDEERQKMRDLFTPANTIALSMTGAEVDLVDDRERKQAFMTDGRKLKKSKDANYQEIAGKFEGNRLATDEKDPRGRKMSRTFELSYDGRQLYETLHMTTSRNDASLVIRFVYDIPIPGQTRQ